MRAEELCEELNLASFVDVDRDDLPMKGTCNDGRKPQLNNSQGEDLFCE